MKQPSRLPARRPSRLPRYAKTAETIGRRILIGDLAPGAVLPNAALLAQEYKLSRPSLREAIKILAAKGLLSAAPKRGTIVRPRADWNRLDVDVLAWESAVAPSPRLIRDLFELRRMVEPEAAALAAQRASPQGVREIGDALDHMATAGVHSSESIAADVAFHRAILIHSGNDFLATFAPVIAASLRTTFETQRTVSWSSDHFIPPHRAIFEAIRDQRPDDARRESSMLLTNAESDALHGLGVEQGVSLEEPSSSSHRWSSGQ